MENLITKLIIGNTNLLKSWTGPQFIHNRGELPRMVVDDTPLSRAILAMLEHGEKPDFGLFRQESPPDLWAHQKEGFQFALSRMQHGIGVMLEIGMGGGKTRLAIEIAKEVGAQRTLILCPKAVFQTWVNHLQPYGYEITCLDEGTTKKKALLVGGNGCLIVNYESFWRADLRDALKKWAPGMLIMDESHKVKSHSGKASKTAYQLAYNSDIRIPYKLALSGTPAAKGPLDLFGQHRILNRELLGTTYSTFQTMYSVHQWTGSYSKLIAYRDIEGLKRLVDLVTFRVSQEELDKNLPPVQKDTIHLSVTPAVRKIYNDLKTKLKATLSEGDAITIDANATIMRLQQVSDGFVSEEGVIRELHTAKVDACVDIVESIGAQPVVIFYRFDYSKQMLKRAFPAALELSGKANESESWKRGMGQVLLVQIQAGGLGVDLTRARYAIYLSRNFSWADAVQSEKRIHRPGQDRPVQYLYLNSGLGIDSLIDWSVERKADVISALRSGHVEI